MTPLALLDTPTGSYPLNATLVGPTIEEIPDEPDAQVAATIARMCQYVCEDSQSTPVRFAAQTALALNPADPLTAVHSFVRGCMRFRNDDENAKPYQWMLKRKGDVFVEALKRPIDVVIEYARTGVPVWGDCDDFSMLCTALLKALDVDCKFATVGADESQPDCFSHVYCVAYVGGQRVPMDCSHMQAVGIEAPNRFGKYCEWRVSYADWKGLGVSLLLAGFAVWKYRHKLQEIFSS